MLNCHDLRIHVMDFFNKCTFNSHPIAVSDSYLGTNGESVTKLDVNKVIKKLNELL